MNERRKQVKYEREIDFPTKDTVRNVDQICENVKGTGSSNWFELLSPRPINFPNYCIISNLRKPQSIINFPFREKNPFGSFLKLSTINLHLSSYFPINFQFLCSNKAQLCFSFLIDFPFNIEKIQKNSKKYNKIIGKMLHHYVMNRVGMQQGNYALEKGLFEDRVG